MLLVFVILCKGAFALVAAHYILNIMTYLYSS